VDKFDSTLAIFAIASLFGVKGLATNLVFRILDLYTWNHRAWTSSSIEWV
jgi:hypothetical protein